MDRDGRDKRNKLGGNVALSLFAFQGFCMKVLWIIPDRTHYKFGISPGGGVLRPTSCRVLCPVLVGLHLVVSWIFGEAIKTIA